MPVGRTHLDLNVVSHCNFACTNCSHASPIQPKWEMSLGEILRDLTALKAVFRCTNLNLVGGEPTLHPQLIEIMRLVKEIRIDDQTHVITNGSRLPYMPEEFWQELEFIKVSIYPKLDKSIPDLVRKKSEQYGFGHEMTEFNEFYQQLEPIPDGSSFHACKWKTDCYTVHKGHFYLCPQSTFFPKSILGLPENVDGLPLEGITEEKLRAFMDRTEPLNACRTCRGYTKLVPWTESRGREKWLENSKITP